MGTDVAGIPRGWKLELRVSRGEMEFVLREPRGDALEISETIKLLVQALEYQVNCAVKFLMWPQNV